MASMQDLLAILEEAENSAEGYGLLMRLDLGDLILEGLREKGWTQKRLAEEAGMKESFVSRIVYAESNCTFEVAARLLYALGIRPKIVREEKAKRAKGANGARSKGKARKRGKGRG